MGINLFCSGVATLTMGSIATGVVEIFGTTNRLLKYYIIVGGILLIIGAITGSIAYLMVLSWVRTERDFGVTDMYPPAVAENAATVLLITRSVARGRLFFTSTSGLFATNPERYAWSKGTIPE